MTEQDAVLWDRTRLKERRIPVLPPSAIWSRGMGTVHPSPKALPPPFKPSPCETDLRRMKNGIMWSVCLIKNWASHPEPEMNIHILSPRREKDACSLTVSEEELLWTWPAEHQHVLTFLPLADIPGGKRCSAVLLASFCQVWSLNCLLLLLQAQFWRNHQAILFVRFRIGSPNYQISLVF